MKKLSLVLLVMVSGPIVANEYIIKAGSDMISSDWIEDSELIDSTDWVATGGLRNCESETAFPVKVDGDIYNHNFNCDQSQAREVTKRYVDSFSGVETTRVETEDRVATVTDTRSISVAMETESFGDLDACTDWAHASSQNSNLNLLDQVRTCDQSVHREFSHNYQAESVYTQISDVVESVEDAQSITRANASCKTLLAQDSRLGSGYHTLSVGSEYCDMTTDGGGWTYVAGIRNSFSSVVASDIAINDKGLSYSEYLVIDKGTTGDYLIPSNNNVWDWKGYDIGKMSFKIGGSWTVANLPTSHIGCDGSDAKLPLSNYSVIQQSGLCRSGANNSTEYCGNLVKVKLPSNQRITAFNDAESLANNCTSDNAMNYNFDLYLR